MSRQARIVILVVMACGLSAVLAMRGEAPRFIDIAVALVVAAAVTFGMHFAHRWSRARGVSEPLFHVLMFIGLVAILVIMVEGFILVTKRYGLPTSW